MYISFNGRLLPEKDPVLQVNNRAFAYGDGLFETIRVSKGRIPLSSYHFNRLFSGLETLKIDAGKLDAGILSSHIFQLCEANQCQENARVRMEVYRSEQGMAQFTIEAKPLDPAYAKFNEEGLHIDLFSKGRKTADGFSHLKSCNYLLYIMAGLFASENSLHDAIVLNQEGRIADAGKANVFLIKNGEIITPALTEGCVAGVMRAFILEKLPGIKESTITKEDLFSAEEIFLTNAVYGIRWVKSIGDHQLRNIHSIQMYQSLLSTIFC